MAIALFIGRFQPFHNGHLWAVKEILKRSDKVIIGIGSSQYQKTAVNPFSAGQRKEMIREALKSEGITSYAIFEIPDLHSDDEWVSHVCRIIPHFDIVFTGSPLSKKLFTEKGFVVEPLPRNRNISASEVRLRILKGMEWKSLVPEPVAGILKHIGAEERIKKCSS